MMDELLTIRDVAAELRLHYRTVQQLIRTGVLPVTKAGPLRVFRSALTAYLARQSSGAALRHCSKEPA